MPNGAIRIKILPFDSALEIVLLTDVKCITKQQYSRGVCKSRNPTRNTRNPPGTPGTPPGTPGTLPGTPETPPGTPGTPPGTPGSPPGTRWNTSYEATHVFLYKFTCFALNSG